MDMHGAVQLVSEREREGWGGGGEEELMFAADVAKFILKLHCGRKQKPNQKPKIKAHISKNN